MSTEKLFEIWKEKMGNETNRYFRKDMIMFANFVAKERIGNN